MSRRDKRVSQAAFAREAKLSRRQVARHIAAGVLELGDDGQLDLAAGRRALAARRKRREAEGDAVAEDNAETRKLKGELVRWQGAWRRATAELRQLELKVRAGEFVAVADVRKDAAKVASVIQAMLRSIPPRVALEVEAALSVPAERRAAVVDRIVSNEVERAIGSLGSESVYVGPFDGKTLNVVCGHCAVRARQEAEEAKRRAEREADGEVASWQDVLRGAFERCLKERPRAGDEIDVDALPPALQSGLGSAALFLRTVASLAYAERLRYTHATRRGEGDR